MTAYADDPDFLLSLILNLTCRNRFVKSFLALPVHKRTNLSPRRP